MVILLTVVQYLCCGYCGYICSNVVEEEVIHSGHI